ncbi:MAG TPA: hypothetical protein VEQ10_12075 [Vicinamibacteria bacterium]|nr:hypothetical protein [Vicinamibacteria bacterium]
MGRFARLFSTPAREHQTLEGFVDSLLQTFENSRPGLTAEMLDEGRVEPFFAELYEREVRSLREKIAHLTHLSKDEQQELFQRVDERIRKVVLPAYARLAGSFTPRERNDFHLAPESLHAVERLGFAVLGLLVGAFVVWAPFIPIWSKEWVLVFGIGGFVFPSLRRYLALRRYEHQLNDLVARTDDEIWRLDLGYLTSAWERGALEPAAETAQAKAEPPRPADPPGEPEAKRPSPGPRAKEGQ